MSIIQQDIMTCKEIRKCDQYKEKKQQIGSVPEKAKTLNLLEKILNQLF